MKNRIPKLALAICFLVAIAFSLKKLREPDLWWQIRTGEWIMEHGGVPKADVFSYTYEGTPWINIKWGFEVLAAAVSKAAGPESVFLLQVIASCLLLFFLLKCARTIIDKHNLNRTTFNAIIPFLLLILLTGIAYRINGRPEMISHLFTAVFLFILLRYGSSSGKKLLLLVPLQMVWANFHEAFATGWVLILIFTFGSWVEYYFSKKKQIQGEVQKPVLLSITAVLSVVVVIINPNGITLLESPLRIFGQVFENKYTTELLGFESYLYWKPEAYIALFMLFITLAGLFTTLQKKSKQKWYFQLLQIHGIPLFLLVAAFVYLASTAYRNIIFLDIVLFPYFAGSFLLLVQKLETRKWITKIIQGLPLVSMLAAIVLYTSIVSDNYYRITKSEDHYGLEVLSADNPFGAANYIEEHKLADKTAFSDYLTSSYLLWKLQPSFKTMIDLRDLDVFPASFFRQFAEAVSVPDSFTSLDKRYRFEYVVLFRPQFKTLHKHLYHDSTYSLVYADAVTALYQKTANKQAPALFSYLKPVPSSSFSKIITAIFNPFYKPYDYAANNEDQHAASYYMAAGDEQMAQAYLQRSLDKGVDVHASYCLSGQILLEKYFADTTLNRQVFLDSAQYYFRKAIKADPEFSDGYLGLGEVSYEQQFYKEAAKHFDKAIRHNAQSVDAYLYLAQCYKMLANQSNATQQKYLRLSIENYEIANKMTPDNPIVLANLGFLYYRINDCDNAVPYLEMVQDYAGLSEKERQSVKECLNKCR